MKTKQINTTQNVTINFKLASVGQRLMAFILDNIIKISYVYLIYEVFSFKWLGVVMHNDYWSAKAVDILVFLPITVYTLISEILMNGQTLGKKVMSIKVIKEDGFKPSITDYIIRWFMRLVDFNFFMLIVVYAFSLGIAKYSGLLITLFFFGKMVGFFLILITKNNQRIGDISANTIVVYLKDKTSFSETILEEISDKYQPTYANVIKLSDNDARIIKETFKKSSKTKDYKTLIKLRTKIEEVTGIKSQQKDDIDFINTVLKDYNYYTSSINSLN